MFNIAGDRTGKWAFKRSFLASIFNDVDMVLWCIPDGESQENSGSGNWAIIFHQCVNQTVHTNHEGISF